MIDKNIPQNKKSLIEKWNEQMDKIEQKTGIKGYIMVILLIISVFLVYLNIFDTVITNLIGTMYPAFWTVKSIEEGKLDEEIHWLTYWAVFGFFIVIDMFNPIIMKVLPFYFILKIIFLILMFIGTGFCNLVYNLIANHILIKYEAIFDEVVDNLEGDNQEYAYEKPKHKKLNINKKNLKKSDEFNMEPATQAGQEINNDEKNNENS